MKAEITDYKKIEPGVPRKENLKRIDLGASQRETPIRKWSPESPQEKHIKRIDHEVFPERKTERQ